MMSRLPRFSLASFSVFVIFLALAQSDATLRPCPNECGGIGNCDAVLGICECPFGFFGEGCEGSTVTQCPTPHIPIVTLKSITDRAWNTATMVKTKSLNIGPWPCTCLKAVFSILNMRFGFEFLCLNESLDNAQAALESGHVSPDSWGSVTMAKPDEIKGAAAVHSSGVAIPVFGARGTCGVGCDGFCEAVPSNGGAAEFVCRCWREGAIYMPSKQKCELHRKTDKYQACLNECSGRGVCEGLFCRCRSGFWGPDCGLTVKDGQAMTTQQAKLEANERGASAINTTVSVRYYVYTLPLQYRVHYTHTHELMCKHVMNSPYRTADPAAAQFFVLTNGDDVMQGRRGNAMLRWVRDTHPWYNATKSQGFTNHILMLTKDYAWGSSWWRPLARLDSSSYEPEFNPCHPDRNILALAFADYRDGADAGDAQCRVCFQRGKDIQIPPLESAADGACHIVYNRATVRKYSPWSATRSVVNERKYTLFFAGHSVEYPEDKDVPGRWILLKHHADREGFLILSTHGNHSIMVPLPVAMTSSVFCYIPLGRTDPGYTGRFVHALLFGCIPVFWQPRAERSRALEELPEMQWAAASLTVRAPDIASLHEVLAAVPRDRIQSMQARLESMWKRMLWSSVFGQYLQEGIQDDAWDGVMRVLQLRWKRHQRQDGGAGGSRPTR